MFTAVVLLALAAIGAGAFYGFWRLLSNLDKRAVEVEQRVAEEPDEMPEIREPLGPDGLVYLCADRFAPPRAPRSVANPRLKAIAPLSGEELEPRELAEQLLYALFVSLLKSNHLRSVVAETDATFVPPFPHKRWSLRLVRLERLGGCPLAETLNCAFDLAEQRLAKKGGNVEEGIAVDELVEDMLKVMRQEMSFWEKAGVYTDIRQYVEAALVDQGYLIRVRRTTWLDRLRHARPSVNEQAIAYVEETVCRLEEALRAFRQAHGSEVAVGAESVPGGLTEEVDQQLLEASPPFDEMPLHDCLKISIYEALLAIRQLEPSEDVGV
jgi:hypothetical protein